MQISRKQLDEYSAGKEIPKVEISVVNEQSQKALVHKIKFTGVKPPRDFVRITRPLHRPSAQPPRPIPTPGDFYCLFYV